MRATGRSRRRRRTGPSDDRLLLRRFYYSRHRTATGPSLTTTRLNENNETLNEADERRVFS